MRVGRITQPFGDGGTRTTLAVMAQLIRNGSMHPLVRSAAIKLTRGVGERDQVGQLDVLRHFLSTHMTFMADPQGVELVQAPDVLLREILADGVAPADCDDVAVLGGALAKAIGYPVRLVAVSLDGRSTFGHVWVEARNRRGRWIEFDVTRSAQGIERNRIGRSLVIGV